LPAEAGSIISWALKSPRTAAAAGVDCFENAIALLGGPRALAG
jgi:hypothetical protein